MTRFHKGGVPRFHFSAAVAEACRHARRIATQRSPWGLVFSAVALIGAAAPAAADRIKHPIAVFSGLDKITGRIISFEVGLNETVQFGSLQITERACYTRPPTEAPQTTSFLDVDEIDVANNYKRIFSGWMFASSPGLHALEHPVYDVWLVDCKGGTEVIPTQPDGTQAAAPPPPPPDTPAKPSPQPKPARPKRVPPPSDDGQGDFPAGNGRNGPIEVGPPPGFNGPPPDRRAPTQRYYPTTPDGTDSN